MIRNVVAVLSGVVLALALVPGVATAAPQEPRGPLGFSGSMSHAAPVTPAAAGQVLVRQRATLTQHAAGFPKTNKRHWRLARATIDIEVLSSLFIHAYVDLGDYGVESEPASVSVQFGHRQGSSCDPKAAEWSETDSDTRQHHLFGYSPNAWGPKPSKPWDCVLVATTTPDGTTLHDAMVAPLVNTYEAPRFTVGKVAVLGQKQKVLKVAKGGWTPVEVTVANRGTRAAGQVTVTAKGRGLKVTRGSLDRLAKGGSSSAVIRVKPVGRKKPGKLRITAHAAGGVVAHRTIRAKRVKAPKKPAAGSYRNGSGTVRFSLKKGRVTGFRVTTLTQCGGYGSIPTSQQTTYDFPKRKIPRNGILTASARGKAYGTPWSTTLRFRVAGKKVTRGLFTYYGPGGCSAVEGFNAKRAGR